MCSNKYMKLKTTLFLNFDPPSPKMALSNVSIEINVKINKS